eukprot:4290737-Pleurochrysis_carterae.AAC.5
MAPLRCAARPRRAPSAACSPRGTAAVSSACARRPVPARGASSQWTLSVRTSWSCWSVSRKTPAERSATHSLLAAASVSASRKFWTTTNPSRNNDSFTDALSSVVLLFSWPSRAPCC